jgi:hypothetical protein
MTGVGFIEENIPIHRQGFDFQQGALLVVAALTT